VVAVVAGALLVAIGVAVFVVWPRGGSPVTKDEAIADFREQSGSDPDQDATADLPEPGVYTYAASGQEEVKLGILPTETRPYPDEMFVTVVAGPRPECFVATLNLLDQHSEDTTYCTDEDGGLHLADHQKRQQVGALSPSATMTCDPDVLYEPGTSSTDLACELRLAAGPTTLTASLTGTSHTTEDRTVDVDGRAVDAVLVDVRYAVSGDLTGSWHERIWFARENWLPLRIERTLDLQGLATFTEQSELVLTSLTPSG